MTYNPTPVDLPQLVGTRWTEVGLIGGLVYSDHQFADIADVVTTPGDMVWANEGANKTAAPLDDAEFTGGAFVFQHDEVTGSDQWWSGTYNAPFYYATIVDPTAQGLLVEAHLDPAVMADITGGGARNDCGLLVAKTGADGVFTSLIGIGIISGAFIEHRVGTATTVANASRTDPQMETGNWVRLVILQDGSVSSYYYTAAVGTVPTESDWVFIGTSNEYFAPTDLLSMRVGVYSSVISGASGTTPWTISKLRIAVARATATGG